MKTTFVIFALCIAFFKAGSSEPTDVSEQVKAATGKCITELNLKKSDVVEGLKLDVVPEDNEKAQKFFACLSTELGIVNDAGDTDFDKLLPVVEDMIKQRLGPVEDAAAKAKAMATAAIEQCKDTPKTDNVGLTCIKIRNCIRGVTLKAEN